MTIKDQLNELVGTTCRIEGNHPDGRGYTHSVGKITDVWGTDPNYPGFRFKETGGGGYVWPGINRIEQTVSRCKCFYTNTFGQVGCANIIKEGSKQ